MQTSINYRPATDGLSRIVEARFGTWDKMNTDCLHLQEIPLPDIPPPSRHHKQKHPNDCSELRHRCCRRNCRNFPIYKADGKDWQLCLRKKRRYLSNSSSLSSCLLYCYTLNVVETQIFIQSLTLLITHHGLSLWTWHLQVQTGGESFFSLLSRSFMLYYQKILNHLHFSCIFPTILLCRQHTRHLHSEV